MRYFPCLTGLATMLASASVTTATVLYLNHFDASLDADHSQYGEPSATATGATLSKDGQGYPFAGVTPQRALDVGYSATGNQDAGVRYPAVNLDSRRGTIEMWVKTAWDADALNRRKTDLFRFFLSAPLENKGSLGLYYACYRWNGFSPALVFHINDGKTHPAGEPGPDFIISFRLCPDEKGEGFVWKKDTWHYLVATWTPTTLRLFCDGQLVAERTFEKPIDIPRVSGPIGIGNNAGNWGGAGWPADALIDEVRICDQPLYDGEKTVARPTAPLPAVIKSSKVVSAGGFEVMTQPDPRQYYCYRVATPPVIDGKLDDEVWNKLPAWSGFLVLGKFDQYVANQTEVRLCRDDQYIYAAAFLHESRTDLLKATAQPGEEDPRVFGDDCVEFYFGPKQNDVPDVQLGINSVNAHCDILHTPGKSNFKWNGTWKSAVTKTNGGWIVEIAFPYKDINGVPRIGDIWGFRLGRNRASAGELSCLNYENQGFQNPSDFARLIMAGDLPRLDATKEEEVLNQDYIRSLRKEVAKFTADAVNQLEFGKDIPAQVKKKSGIAALEADIRAVVKDANGLLGARKPAPIERWNELALALNIATEKLDQFGYLAANVGGMQAALPPASLTGIRQEAGVWYVASPQLAAAISPQNGTVLGIWDRATGQRLVVNSYLLYEVQTRKEIQKFDERFDRVQRISDKGNELVVQCTNPKLRGVALRKVYSLADVDGEPRILCRRLEISGNVPEMTLLQTTSRTLFDEEFRKPSFYNRIFVIGTMGDGEAVHRATDITRPTIERAWFNSTEGRAQFSLVNPTTNIGLAEYLYKENGAWTFPQAMAQSYWTPFGWDMGFCQTFVKKKPYTAELRFHLFHGDRLVFHREYIQLPEYAAIRHDWTPSPLVDRLSLNMGVNVMQNLDDNPAAQRYYKSAAGGMKQLMRPDELGLSLQVASDTRWPDLPTGDDAELVQTHNNKSGVILDRWPAKKLKDAVIRVKKGYPGILGMNYNFIIDICKESHAFQEHPEWRLITREGTPQEGVYGTDYVRANWCPSFMDFLTKRLLATCDYFDLDVCYLDYGVGILTADWGRGEVIGFPVYLGFIKSLHAELAKRGKILFLNSFVGQPYYDLGYFEGTGASPWGKTWRSGADVTMMSRFYLPEGVACVPLYWHGGKQFKDQGSEFEVRYLDLAISSGHMAAACYLDPYAFSFPAKDGGADWASVYKYYVAVQQACFEIRQGAWAEVGLKPAWWRDFATQLEAYTLRLANAYLVNVISHETTAKDTTLTVDLNLMKFDPAKRLFIWQLLRRDYANYPQGVPVPPNWDEMFGSRVCRSVVPGRPEFSYVIPQLPSERLCVTTLTQTPAAIISAAGIPTQTLLPSVLNCRLTGSADESAKRVTLQVNCDKPIEVIAWWPKAWGRAAVKVGDQETAVTPVSFGAEDFVRFAVEAGEWAVTVFSR